MSTHSERSNPRCWWVDIIRFQQFYTDGVIISLHELSFSVRVTYPFSVRSRNCLLTAVRLIPAASASCGIIVEINSESTAKHISVSIGQWLQSVPFVHYVFYTLHIYYCLQKFALKGLYHQPLSDANLQNYHQLIAI